MLVQFNGLVEVELVSLGLLFAEAEVLEKEVDGGQEGALELVRVGGGGGRGCTLVRRLERFDPLPLLPMSKRS